MATKIDPSLYAFSLSLELETGDAHDALDMFEDDILKIEHQVADIAQKAIGEIEDSGSKAIKTLDSMKSVLDSLKISGTDAGATLDTSKTLNDTMNLQQELNQLIDDEFELLTDIVDLFDEVQEVLKQKNLLHEAELGLVDDENKSLSEMLSEWIKIGAVVGTSVYTINQLAEKLAGISEDTEKFTNANYRLFGSQMELLNATRMLTAETDIFYGTALEAMLVLGDLRVPRNELEQYAKMVGTMNRVTGIAIPSIAQYANHLRSVGRTADQVEDHLLTLQETMRKFSLSAADMSKILDTAAFSARELEYIFADEGAAEKYALIKLEVSALAKSLGVTGDMAAALDAALADPRTLALWEDALGRTIRTTEDFQAATGAMAQSYGTNMLAMEKAIAKGGAGAIVARAEQQALIDTMFNGNKTLYDYATRLAEVHGQSSEMLKLAAAVEAGGPAALKAQKELIKLGKARGLEGKELDSHIAKLQRWNTANALNLSNLEYQHELMDSVRKNAMDPFSEANDTLIAQLRILQQRVTALIARAWEPLERVLKNIFKYVNAAIDSLMWFGNALYKYIYEPLNKITGGLFGKFFDWIIFGVAVVGMFVLALGALAVTLGFIPGLIGFVTRMIIGFFRGLGQGVAAFASAVAAHTITLLQLAVAFALIGAGAWMLVQAFQIITQRGWEGIAMFAVFGAVLIGFIIALVWVSSFAWLAIPALLAIGGAVALIGLGMALAGAGVWLMAQSLELIATFGFVASAALIALAAALGILALAGYFGFTGLMLAATALWAIAIPVFLVGLGFQMLAAAVGVLTFEAITTAALGLLAGAAIMLAAAGILWAAAGLLLLAMPALWVAAINFVISAAVLLAGGVAFGIAAGLLFVGALGFLFASAMIFVGANVLFAAGLLMIVGSAILLGASYLLIIASSTLLAATPMLWGGATGLLMASAILMVAATSFTAASAYLLVGSMMFLGAAVAIFIGAALMSLAGIMIYIGGAAMLVGLVMLIAAAGMMWAVSVAMWVGSFALASAIGAISPVAYATLIAGLALFVGALGLYVGAVLLYASAMMFIETGYFLVLGSRLILSAADDMLRAIDMIGLFGALALSAAWSMIWGASLLIFASGALAISAFFLAGVSFVLGVAALGLVTAGFLLWLGSLWISGAVERMAKRSEDFYKFAEAMSQIADGLKALADTHPKSIIATADALVIAAPKMKKAIKDLDGIGLDFNRALAGFDPKQTEILKLAPILNRLAASLSAVDISTEPLDRIRTSLDLINEAIVQLDNNADNLVKNLSDFGPVLEQQAEQIEAAAQRIQEAIENRGVPAMRAAQDAGLAQVQQGDVLATVQVMPNQEGRERTREEELNEFRNAQLAKLVELLEGLTGQEDLKNINELLAAVLPGLGGHDSSNLHNAMNQWTG